jgi:hypothetical protein
MFDQAKVLRFNRATNGDLEGGALVGYAVVAEEVYHLIFDEAAYTLYSPRELFGDVRNMVEEDSHLAFIRGKTFHWNMVDWRVLKREECIAVPLGNGWELRLRRGSRYTFTVLGPISTRIYPMGEYRILERFKGHSLTESVKIFEARQLSESEIDKDIQLIRARKRLVEARPR